LLTTLGRISLRFVRRVVGGVVRGGNTRFLVLGFTVSACLLAR